MSIFKYTYHNIYHIILSTSYSSALMHKFIEKLINRQTNLANCNRNRKFSINLDATINIKQSNILIICRHFFQLARQLRQQVFCLIIHSFNYCFIHSNSKYKRYTLSSFLAKTLKKIFAGTIF